MKEYPLLTLPHSNIPILTPEQTNERLDELLAMPIEKVALYIADAPSYEQGIKRAIGGIIIQKPTVEAIAAICNYERVDDATLHKMAINIAWVRKFHKREDIQVDIFTLTETAYKEFKDTK